jgi:hypothetical protein
MHFQSKASFVTIQKGWGRQSQQYALRAMFIQVWIPNIGGLHIKVWVFLYLIQVALKSMILIHRTLREGDPTFREELINYSHSRVHILNLSNFKDDSSPNGVQIWLCISSHSVTWALSIWQISAIISCSYFQGLKWKSDIQGEGSRVNLTILGPIE